MRRKDIITAMINKVTQSVLDNGSKKVFHDTSSVPMDLINMPGLELSIAVNASKA